VAPDVARFACLPAAFASQNVEPASLRRFIANASPAYRRERERNRDGSFVTQYDQLEMR
jgi:hypothetical protein